MSIPMTEEFEGWFNQLSEVLKGRVDASISVFESVREDIAEPHGGRVYGSRYEPTVFALYPARDGKAFIVFCVLCDSTINLVNGYDANSNLHLQNLIDRVDEIIERDKLFCPT
ncbi:MAG: hypothetical protein QOJ84_3506 [Bradyrhizobium sp.]|jgi:hypothetical protein|nr:hypothetical protein [Bradyrhizobium sp.]